MSGAFKRFRIPDDKVSKAKDSLGDRTSDRERRDSSGVRELNEPGGERSTDSGRGRDYPGPDEG